VNRIKLFLLDLFFPNRCPSCDKVISYDRLICEECIANLEKCKTDKNRVCSVCGKDYCENHDYLYYEHTVSCFYYEKEARNGMDRFSVISFVLSKIFVRTIGEI
jgi:competence protein ComFC